MATIHDEIDNWLAADVHDQLSRRSGTLCTLTSSNAPNAGHFIRKTKS